METISLTRKQSERFASSVTKSEECWFWSAVIDKAGYGRFSAGGRSVYAHRLAYEIANGPIGAGLVVDHLCHNRACVNPGHLRAATSKQNSENRAGATVANKSSGVRGVSWHKHVKRWRALVGHGGKSINLGYFDTIEEARAVVEAKRSELFDMQTVKQSFKQDKRVAA